MQLNLTPPLKQATGHHFDDDSDDPDVYDDDDRDDDNDGQTVVMIVMTNRQDKCKTHTPSKTRNRCNRIYAAVKLD